MASAHVAQGARLSGHRGATGTSSAAVSADPGAAALDTVCPTVALSTVSDGQAGDLELNAVDGGGGHWVRLN